MKQFFYVCLCGWLSIFSLQAQAVEYSGRLVDEETGEGLPYVSIQAGDAYYITDKDGNYRFSTTADSIKFLYIGYEEKSLKATEDLNELDNIALRNEGKYSKKVNLTGGYGSSERKKDVPGRVEYERSAPVLSDEMPMEMGITTTAWDGGDDFDGFFGSGQAGLLTAGEINDFSKWTLWDDITVHLLPEYQRSWGTSMLERYSVQLVNKEGAPMVDWRVELRTASKQIIWSARTDNTGKAELWGGAFAKDPKNLDGLKVYAVNGNDEFEVKNARLFERGVNVLTVNQACNQPEAIEIAFIVDATGSMGDEIAYLQQELLDVTGKFKNRFPEKQLRVGSVFYRDHGDAYVTNVQDLTPNMKVALEFISEQGAGGGGDFPEAVDDALHAAVNDLTWSENALTRVAFLILDAPPHQNPENIDRIEKAIRTAAQKGIRLVPVTCSGIDKSTEYLMRCMALATNGTYVFLTNHSGIGGMHIEPTTDSYEVETFNEIMLRILTQYTVAPNCGNEMVVFENDSVADTIRLDEPFVQDTIVSQVDTTVSSDTLTRTDSNETRLPDFTYTIYPNPTTGNFALEVSEEIGEIFVTDMSGKIIQRVMGTGQLRILFDISEFPSGMYFVRFAHGEKTFAEKILLVRT